MCDHKDKVMLFLAGKPGGYCKKCGIQLETAADIAARIEKELKASA